MQQYPEQAVICKIIHNIDTFVHCKVHITMCTLWAKYVKEGSGLQTEGNTLYKFVHWNYAQLVYKVGCLCDLQKCVVVIANICGQILTSCRAWVETGGGGRIGACVALWDEPNELLSIQHCVDNLYAICR